MKTYSLQSRITLTILFCLLATAVVTSVFSFYNVYEEVEELSDENLESIAFVLSKHDIPQTNSGTPTPHDDHNDDHDDDGIMVDIKTSSTLPVGFSDQPIDGKMWRVYHLRAEGKSIITRQHIAIKQELATMAALQSLIPLLIVSTIFALLLPLLIRYSFRSVRIFSKLLNERPAHDLSPIVMDGFPKELLPFIHAINTLLNAAQADINTQKRFIADTSHELRSPLTAMALQVERLRQTKDTDKINVGLSRLEGSIKQNQALINNLLTLARLNHESTHEPTDITHTIKEVIHTLLPIIDDKQIDIHVHLPNKPVMVAVSAISLTLLIKNLISNAVHYTPMLGSIDIMLDHQRDITDLGQLLVGKGSAMDDGVVFMVKDTGIGIHPDDYYHALNPFVRLGSERADVSDQKGTGLGLSMVKAVCEQAGLDLYFNQSDIKPTLDGNTGLWVSVVFPAIR